MKININFDPRGRAGVQLVDGQLVSYEVRPTHGTYLDQDGDIFVFTFGNEGYRWYPKDNFGDGQEGVDATLRHFKMKRFEYPIDFDRLQKLLRIAFLGETPEANGLTADQAIKQSWRLGHGEVPVV